MVNVDPSICKDFVLKTMLVGQGESTFPQGQAALCIAVSSADEAGYGVPPNVLNPLLQYHRYNVQFEESETNMSQDLFLTSKTPCF